MSNMSRGDLVVSALAWIERTGCLSSSGGHCHKTDYSNLQCVIPIKSVNKYQRTVRTTWRNSRVERRGGVGMVVLVAARYRNCQTCKCKEIGRKERLLEGFKSRYINIIEWIALCCLFALLSRCPPSRQQGTL